MAILSKGNTFATGDQVTALKLNNLVDNSTFASGAVDDSTTQLDGSGRIIVKDGGITSAKLNLSATGASQTIATFKTTQTHDSGTVSRSLDIRTPASTTDINSPFEIETGNAIQFICDDHTVTIDSDGKTKFGTGNIESANTSLFQVNINTDQTLGTTSGNEQGILRLVEQAGNTDNLLFTSVRTADGNDWTTAAHRIQRKVDSTKMGFIQFGHHTATNGNTITFGEDETERMRIDAEGHVGIGTTSPTQALQVQGNTLVSDDGAGDFVKQSVSGTSSAISLGGTETSSSSELKLEYNRSTGKFHNYIGVDAATNYMTVLADGKIGIGTNSPTEALQVVGDIKATDTTNSTVIRENGSIELNRASNPFIDFKNSSGDDFDSRIIQSSDGLQLLTGGNSSTQVRLELTSDGTVKVKGQSSNGDAQLQIISDGGTDTSILSFGDDSAVGAGGIRYDHNDDSMRFVTGESERVRIDSSGNVGIGKTSPDTAIHIENTSENQITLTNNSGNFSRIRSERGLVLASDFDTDSGAQQSFMAFETDNVERIRIDSTGDVRIGTTTETGYSAKTYIQNDVSDAEACLTLRHVQTGDRTMMAFVVGSDVVGRINEASGTISLVQGSDYRLKEDIIDMDTAVDKVKLLKPRNYALKKNGVRFDGFIAHELAEVCPQAVFGEKDAMRMEPYEVTPEVRDEEGNVITKAVTGTREVEDHQGIDPTKLVPLLTKALQEALTKIESLEARVAALES